jgi:serine phosphatase RsbU (regulator of sigma subunit)
MAMEQAVAPAGERLLSSTVHRDEVMRHEAFLHGFSSRLGDPQNHQQLASLMATALGHFFEDLTSVELYLPNFLSGEFSPVRDPVGGTGLLAALCTGCQGATGPGNSLPYLVVPNILPGHRVAGRGAMLSAPLLSGTAVLGLIVVERAQTARDFTEEDLHTLVAAAHQVSGLLPAIQLKVLSAAAGWLQRDMASAREIQRTFLPTLESNYGNVRVVAEYHPAFAVGGDFYDMVDLGDGRLLAMIGDVSGKGVAAALMMSRVSSELHQLAAQKVHPAEMLTRVNRSLQERTRDDRFVTVVCVLLDLRSRRWLVANAGHVVPILRRANGTVIRLAYASGPPLGMVPMHAYNEEEFEAHPKDILLLVTDGVFEILDGQREPCSTMGTCRLNDLIATAPHDLSEIRRAILDAVATASAGSRDDVALLGLELTD